MSNVCVVLCKSITFGKGIHIETYSGNGLRICITAILNGNVLFKHNEVQMYVINKGSKCNQRKQAYI